MRRSGRSNLGEGGFAAWLEAVSNKFDGPQHKSKSKEQDGIPESTPINAMAPPTKNRGRKKVIVYLLLIPQFHCLIILTEATQHH